MHASARHVAQVLSERGATGAIRELPETAPTAAAAAAQLGCEVGAIANSLIFSADGEPLLILTSGAHRVDTGMDRRSPRLLGRQTRRSGLRPLGDRPGDRRRGASWAPGTDPHPGRPVAGQVRRGLGRRRTPQHGVPDLVRRTAQADRRRARRGVRLIRTGSSRRQQAATRRFPCTPGTQGTASDRGLAPIPCRTGRPSAFRLPRCP